MSVKESWTERERKREGNRRRRDRVEWRGLAGSQFSNQGSWHEGEPTGGQWDFYFSPLPRYAGALPSPLPHPPWIKISLCAAVTEFIKHLHVLSPGRTTLLCSFLSPAYTHSTRLLRLSRFHCSLNWPSSTCVASTVVFFFPKALQWMILWTQFWQEWPQSLLSLASGCHMGSLYAGGGDMGDLLDGSLGTLLALITGRAVKSHKTWKNATLEWLPVISLTFLYYSGSHKCVFVFLSLI